MSLTISPAAAYMADSPRGREATIVANQAAPHTLDAQWPGDEYELLNRIVSNFEDAELSSQEARALSERDRDYKDGLQLTAEELRILRRRGQPAIYNNIIGRKIELLRGLERRGRSDPEAYPRTPAENINADAATQALRYISDENRFDVIRSSVYDNMLVEGFGGAEVIVEPSDDGNGYDVTINYVPWDRLYFDPHSQDPAFTDAKFLGCVIWMDLEDALDMYPDSDDILSATLEGSRSDTYDDKPRNAWGDLKRRRVRVIQHHFKRKQDWWVATLTKGGFLEQPMLSPYLDRKGHRACPLIMRSARVDRQNNRMGIVRDMIPLQDEINKRRSKLLHAVSVNQIVAEEGAVQDEDHARREAAKPDGYIKVNPGFKFDIRKDEGDIQGQMHLLQDAVEQMNLTGPNAAMAGKDPRELSGRAIIAQQSGGQMENEPLSDTLRQWTHKVYEAAWMRVRQFWTSERWVRVTDDDKNVQFVGLNHPLTIAELLSRIDQAQPLQQQIQALPPMDQRAVQIGMQLPPGDPRLQTVVRIENDINDMDVSITVEEGPDNPTMAAEQFQQIMSLPPQVLQQFPPEFIIQASSLRNKDQLLKLLQDHQAQQAQGQQAAQQQAHDMAQAKIAVTQATAADKQAQANERMHGMAMDHATTAQQPVVPGVGTVAPDQNPLLQPQQAPATGQPTASDPYGVNADPMAQQQQAMDAQQQAHQQQMDQAQLGLQAQNQAHNQLMDRARFAQAQQQAKQQSQQPGRPA